MSLAKRGAMAGCFRTTPEKQKKLFLLLIHRSVDDSPAVKPLQMRPLRVWSNHAKADSPEQPVEANDDHVQGCEDTPLDFLVQSASHPVHTESHHDDGEPQSWVVMMHVCNAAHGNERNVVEYPADNWIDT